MQENNNIVNIESKVVFSSQSSQEGIDLLHSVHGI